ncbi:MAG: LptF/LptG family permease [Planctomycetes bacterium]|nr:LptF/LptG family permease [Planctomycetota bacterium]
MRLFRARFAGHLDRYIGRLFVASYATALLLVVGLAVIFDLTSHLSYFERWEDGTQPSTWTVARYYLLNTPFVFLQVAPYVTLTAGLFTLSRLIKHNEITASLAAGVSAHRTLLPILGGAVLAAGGMFFLREYATTTLGPLRDSLRDYLEEQRLEPVHEKVWVRDQAGNHARIAEFRPHAGEFGTAEIRGLLAVMKARGAWTRITAERALWQARGDGTFGWLLVHGEREIVDLEASRQGVQWLDDISITPEDISLWIKGRERALELSFSEVDALLARDPDNAAYQTLLQYHLTFPLANFVLLLVALPFLLGRERGKAIEGIMLGLLCCVFYFCTEFMARELGVEGVLSPLLASWLPILLFGSLGFALFDSMRT